MLVTATAAGIRAFAFSLHILPGDQRAHGLPFTELYPRAKGVPDSRISLVGEAYVSCKRLNVARPPKFGRHGWYALPRLGAYLKRKPFNPSRSPKATSSSRAEGSHRRAELLLLLALRSLEPSPGTPVRLRSAPGETLMSRLPLAYLKNLPKEGFCQKNNVVCHK